MHSSSRTKGGPLAVQREQTNTGEYHAVSIFNQFTFICPTFQNNSNSSINALVSDAAPTQ